MKQREFIYDEPFFLQWHITDTCNLSCQHCYREKSQPELPLKDLLSILDKFTWFLKEINRDGRIQFTGGEPFLSPHLFTLIKEARKRKISTRILSNGTAITDRTVELLKESGCSLVQISLEGDAAVNDQIRGVDSFNKATTAIDKLRQNGIEVTVNMTLSKQNAGEIEKVINLARAKARRFTFSRIVPMGRAKESIKETWLESEELKKVFQKVLREKKAKNNLEIPLRDPIWHEFLKVSPKQYDGNIHGCSVGFNGFAVDTDGTMYPCRRLPIPLGNALVENITALWRTSKVLNDLRNRDLLKGKCNTCQRRWLCGGCRGIAYALSGDYLAEDQQCFKKESVWQKCLAMCKQ